MVGENNSNDPLKIQIKTAVKKTNGILADLEDQFHRQMEPFRPSITNARNKLSEASVFIKYMYERRHEYGGLITAGAAGMAGTTSFLRRWRLLPAVASATVTGTVTYGLIYGLDEIFETNESHKK